MFAAAMAVMAAYVALPAKQSFQLKQRKEARNYRSKGTSAMRSMK